MSSTFVIGGVRSGKSAWAVRYAEPFAHKTFIATAGAVDEDMRERIARHQKERGTGWHTLEVGRQLVQAVKTVHSNTDCIVVDCLTVWTSLIMNDALAYDQVIRDEVMPLAEIIRDAQAEIILVTNEVGMGIHPEYESGRRFRDLLGNVNQIAAHACDNVILFVAGIPTVVKGEIPHAE